MTINHEEADASILIQARNGDLAQALGKVIGHALNEVGFGNVSVVHNPTGNEGDAVEQSDFEQGGSMLDAIADANPSLFQSKIDVLSFKLDDDTDLLPPEESAHLAEIIAADDDDS